MENILERLQRGDVIVGDGALGTMLMKRGLKHGDPPEAFNLERPQILEEIASLYLDAGAEIVTTNTFGATSLRLRQFSLEKEMEAINRGAVEAVRRAVRGRAYVSGSVGPVMIKPLGDTGPDEAYAAFQQQMRVLIAAGVDMICIETMIDLAEATLAVKAARSLSPKIPLMATMTFAKAPKGFATLMGTSPAKAAAGLESAGANIVGSNCGDGMDNMVGIAREFVAHSHIPVAIQGNAGLPISTESGLVYPETPEFVADKAREMLDLGVRIIGGCCGSTPDHIRAIREVVEAHRKGR
jgi:5-methyltetrahydrofolate--homocysteine methyltransferase